MAGLRARRTSATELGLRLVEALAERDFARIADALAPGVRMRGLLPSGPLEVCGAAAVAARYSAWFGSAETVELVQSASDEVADRLHVTYRLRVNRPDDGWKIVEQHALCALDDGRITALDLVCTGFRPDPSAALS